MEILYQSRSIKISYIEPTGILECRWSGYQSFSTVKPYGMKILDIVRTKEIVYILNDNTDVTGHWTDSTKWTTEYWFPAIWSAGVRHFAWVYPKDYFARASVLAVSAGPKVQFFESAVDARLWLEMCSDIGDQQ